MDGGYRWEWCDCPAILTLKEDYVDPYTEETFKAGELVVHDWNDTGEYSRGDEEVDWVIRYVASDSFLVEGNETYEELMQLFVHETC